MNDSFGRKAYCRATQGLQLAVLALCAGCLPLPRQYYVASAEGSGVQSMSCAGGSPYGASFNSVSPKVHLLVSIEASSLVVVINAEASAVIGLDPTLIRVGASGLTIPLESIRYRQTIYVSELARESSSRIEVNTGHLEVDALLRLKDKPDVHVQLPPVTVNGSTLNFPNLLFKLQSRVHLTMIVGNC
jgi:hypothetical protein